MKKAAIYERASIKEQEKFLDVRLEKCRLYADLLDYHIEKEIIELEKSVNNRNELQELLAVLETKNIKVLIIFRLNRLARDSADLNYFFEVAENKGIELLSVNDSINMIKNVLSITERA